MNKNITIYDISNACGLSSATVSRVLSGSSYPVSDFSRKTVLDTAKKLNYMPNLLGKSLKNGQSRDIGVIVPNISNPYYSLLLQGIYDSALKSEYNIILSNSYRNPETEEKNIGLLLQKQVCGIILVSISNDTEKIKNAANHGCKMVLLEQTSDVGYPQISVDFINGAYAATKYLISLGHKKIGFIGAPLDRPSRKQMLSGYKKALSDSGLELKNEYIKLSFAENDSKKIYEFENGASAANSFSDSPDMPSAYICINDMTALGAIKTFEKNGFSVPRDISVVGFDNIAYGEISTPALTTVDGCAYEMGSLASETIISEIEEKAGIVQSKMLMPKLIIRKSAGKKT